MANQKDKTSIFLTIFVVFIILAMAIYGYIYRDKIGELVQKFTKKTDQTEKISILTNKGNRDNSAEKLDKERIERRSEKTNSDPENAEPVLPEEKTSRPEKIGKPNTPGKLNLSEPTDEVPVLDRMDPKMDFSKNLPDKNPSLPQMKTRDSYPSDDKLEFQKTKKSKHKKLRSKKSKSNLEKRVSRLERKLGVKKKKKGTLAKRVLRLEKIVSKKRK